MMPIRGLDAASIGLLVEHAFRRPGNAVVLACFERSFCLEAGGTLITIGDLDLHDGPLNVRLAGAYGPGLSSALDIERGQRWTVSSARLLRRDGLEFDLTRATVWQPAMPTTGPDRSKLSASLRQLRSLLDERELPEDGLIRLVLGNDPPRTATERVARPHIDALKADLPKCLKEEGGDPNAATQLLGLGPGLTPSGDDLLAGLMIAWHHLGASAASSHLGSILLAANSAGAAGTASAARTAGAAGTARTTPISLAHLGAAAKGYGAAPLHHLLDILVTCDRPAIAEALDVTAKIGHSSGLDAVAGVILALDAWLRVDREAPIAA